MFESLTESLARNLTAWSHRMIGPELEEKVAAARRQANEYGHDPFGYSVDYAIAGLAPLIWMYKHYFHARTEGLEKIPAGRVLLVSNHSGQLPFDAAMIGIALLVECTPPRMIRSMVERWMPTLPYVSIWMARVGQVVGTRDNARRLLEREQALLVCPEGVRGLNKLYRDRYQLAEFGLGFIKIALETNTPIVPVAVVGAEEQSPALFQLDTLAKLFRMPAFPITPTLLPLPLPARYYLQFGDPIQFEGSPNDDDGALREKADTVKQRIQEMLDRKRAERTQVYF